MFKIVWISPLHRHQLVLRKLQECDKAQEQQKKKKNIIWVTSATNDLLLIIHSFQEQILINLSTNAKTNFTNVKNKQ